MQTNTQSEVGAKLSEPMRRALVTASTRERANICPIVGVHAAAEDVLIEALERRGLIEWDGGVPFKSAPRINAAGRLAVQS